MSSSRMFYGLGFLSSSTVGPIGSTMYVALPNGKWRLRRARLMPNESVTANAVDYVTYTLQGSDHSTTIATRATSSTGFTAGTSEDMTLSEASAPGALDYTGGTHRMRVLSAASGAGVDSETQVLLEFEQIVA